MRVLVSFLILFSNFPAFSAGRSIEIVEEVEHRETRRFCSNKNESNAEKQCGVWLANQKKSLGDRLLTYYCGPGEHREKAPNCSYQTVGELKYVLRKYRTEVIGK